VRDDRKGTAAIGFGGNCHAGHKKRRLTY
jgi:hypothetical protein